MYQKYEYSDRFIFVPFIVKLVWNQINHKWFDLMQQSISNSALCVPKKSMIIVLKPLFGMRLVNLQDF